MSYQVLARKWRPRLFREMVGQTHVLQALINALDHNRLHHAYLFTGTRGVGKTTIARILAKCLNCEVGISSEPCGTCSACREIDEGRFVDLIEVDAASRTKVEDTRELLDNVQYAPSRGRFKVYLIDEVHMLSSHSFNALLKTLEEPPEHVKFLLATTDPQKLPVTILSRCLQFSLKNMPPERVVDHLRHVLTEETIRFDDESLWLLGRAADGSMRDGLSLTDQAIAFGNGTLEASQVRTMLGTIDHGQVFGLLEALAVHDARALLAAVGELAEQGADFAGVLAELISTLQRLAIAQVLPDGVDNSQGDRERVVDLAGRISAEDVQLFYQMALHGRRDLPLSPDPRGGFEMALLRMLAFRPATDNGGALPAVGQTSPGSGKPVGLSQAKAEPQETRPASEPPSSVSSVSSESVPSQAADGALAQLRKNLNQPSREPQRDIQPQTRQAAPPKPVGKPTAPVEPTRASEEPAPAATATAAPAKGTSNRPLNVSTPVKPPVNEPPQEWLQTAPIEAPEGPDDDEEEPLDLSAYLNEWDVAGAVEPEAPVIDKGDEVSDLPVATGLAAQWLDLFPRLVLSGLTQSIAAHCQLIDNQGDAWRLRLDPGHSALYNENHRQRIERALAEHLGREVHIDVDIAAPDQETPAVAAARRRVARQREAEASIQADPLVQRLRDEFAAQICDDSIRPLDASTS
ncbi:DNA polymerase III, gamma subunit /DNA polymerase III, tau subunit [Halopseudomonas xinjiangensis]|uniref:DNA polymerase III subunit gamma/tau n=1 Tax=Halopseudomonas xinjiangensis TaxID=487184 RepID=A0A1H1U1V1_9GAMM|nr:DNA polymerase III subunit gamma/tau [Halopseudomonas xinjiangensis]SDS66448.1 DNA polymerase III, gamma subunit /DNA polymerase III, tau subunit [Halopseudomonas xinjiangensis]